MNSDPEKNPPKTPAPEKKPPNNPPGKDGKLHPPDDNDPEAQYENKDES